MRALVAIVATSLALTACSGEAAPPDARPSAPLVVPADAPTYGPSAPTRYTQRWAAPSLAEEAALPAVRTRFPSVVDLAADVPDAPDAEAHPIRRARAAFALPGDRVLLVADDERRILDVSRLEDVPGPDGRPIDPVSDRMLSPTGSYLAFAQTDHVLLFTLATGRWSTIDDNLSSSVPVVSWARGVGDAVISTGWIGRGTIYKKGGLSLPELGPQMSTMLTNWVKPGWSYGVTDLATVMDPPAVAETRVEPTATGGRIHVLPLLHPRQLLVIEGADRHEGCCPMVGMDGDAVVYESRDVTEVRLLRWVVGTDDVGLVTRVTGLERGAPYVGSWAATNLP